MARKPRPNLQTSPAEQFRIGPFVLETLTTGMYERSSNALREYVQNAYDATRAAVAAGVLASGEGKVTVTLPDKNTLIIEDNGIGLSLQSAWSTLTAIGASKKDRARDAGFRGIGRLAAIAFCEELSFRTKVAGEGQETVVTFDCAKLRKGMSSGSAVTSLTDLLEATVSHDVGDDVEEGEHYMVVTLSGLAAAPEEMRSIDDIRAYLAETSPIGFEPGWARGREIVERAKAARRPFETVKLHVGKTEAMAAPVYKPYGDIYRKARQTKATGGTTPLSRVDYKSGSNWWCWIGVPRDSGLLADGATSGLRVRVKNIQVDGTTILDRLFAEENESYARFNKFYVGEIHIDATAVVPNARRDGFEDDQGWRGIRKEIYDAVCSPLREEAYERSEKGKKTVDAVKTKVQRLSQDVERHLRLPQPTPTAWATTVAKVEKIRTQVASAVMEADPEATTPLRAQLDLVQHMKDRLEGKLEPDAERRLRKEIRTELLEQVEQIIQPYLETAVYVRVRKQLRERLG